MTILANNFIFFLSEEKWDEIRKLNSKGNNEVNRIQSKGVSTGNNNSNVKQQIDSKV